MPELSRISSAVTRSALQAANSYVASVYAYNEIQGINRSHGQYNKRFAYICAIFVCGVLSKFIQLRKMFLTDRNSRVTARLGLRLLCCMSVQLQEKLRAGLRRPACVELCQPFILVWSRCLATGMKVDTLLKPASCTLARAQCRLCLLCHFDSERHADCVLSDHAKLAEVAQQIPRHTLHPLHALWQ